MDEVTLKIWLKFATVIGSGLYFGGCSFLSRVYLPTLYEFDNSGQTVSKFQKYYRSWYLTVLCLISGCTGILVYLIEQLKNELPFVNISLVLLTLPFYTQVTLYFASSNRELSHITNTKVNLDLNGIIKFTYFHHVTTLLSGLCFLAYAYYTFCT